MRWRKGWWSWKRNSKIWQSISRIKETSWKEKTKGISQRSNFWKIKFQDWILKFKSLLPSWISRIVALRKTLKSRLKKRRNSKRNKSKNGKKLNKKKRKEFRNKKRKNQCPKHPLKEILNKFERLKKVEKRNHLHPNLLYQSWVGKKLFYLKEKTARRD